MSLGMSLVRRHQGLGEGAASCRCPVVLPEIHPPHPLLLRRRHWQVSVCSSAWTRPPQGKGFGFPSGDRFPANNSQPTALYPERWVKGRLWKVWELHRGAQASEAPFWGHRKAFGPSLAHAGSHGHPRLRSTHPTQKFGDSHYLPSWYRSCSRAATRSVWFPLPFRCLAQEVLSETVNDKLLLLYRVGFAAEASTLPAWCPAES